MMTNWNLLITDLNWRNSISWIAKSKIYLLLLCFLYGCNANNSSVGKGVFNFEPNQNETIQIYPAPKLRSPSFEISVDFIAGRPRLYKSYYGNDSIDFSPLSYGQLQGYFSVRVVRVQDGWLQVVTDESTGALGWIVAPKTEIESWENFLTSVHHINGKDGRLYKSPNSKETHNSNGNYCFNLIEIQNDWLKVYHSADRCDDKTVWDTGPSGFIRWKKDGKLLLNFRM
ncbi:hypothetical protein [Roseivirga sp.]|uniref:hypothetical protein n=1 Tax=Roseivirga sp. TaxID=1964215 RepID=UPI003B8B274F